MCILANSRVFRTVIFVNLNARQIAILAILVLLGLLAIAPALLLKNGGNSNSEDIAFQALKTYSRSQLGDRSADSAATTVYPTFKRTSENGDEFFSRLGSNGICWELNLSKSSEPYKADASRCDKGESK
jgi:hypothetical protein